jgi:hypothetical protein
MDTKPDIKEEQERIARVKVLTRPYLNSIISSHINPDYQTNQIEPELSSFISAIKNPNSGWSLDYDEVNSFMINLDPTYPPDVLTKEVLTKCINEGCDDFHGTIRQVLSNLGVIDSSGDFSKKKSDKKEQKFDFGNRQDQNKKMKQYISGYINHLFSFDSPRLSEFLGIINGYTITLDMENDNFNFIFKNINHYFGLDQTKSNKNVIRLSNFFEPVRFYSFLFPYGPFNQELDKEFYDYCNNIISQIIECYLEVGNITKINITDLNIDYIKEIPSKNDDLSQLLETNIASVVKSFISGNEVMSGGKAEDEVDIADLSGGGMVGGAGFIEKIARIPSNLQLENGFSNINGLLNEFKDDVQMTYYILSLYIEARYDTSALNSEWLDFYTTYISLNYFFPDIFNNYSDLSKFGSNDDDLNRLFSQINKSLMGNMKSFEEINLNDDATNSFSSEENIKVFVDILEREVGRLEAEYSIKEPVGVGVKVGVGVRVGTNTASENEIISVEIPKYTPPKTNKKFDPFITPTDRPIKDFNPKKKKVSNERISELPGEIMDTALHKRKIGKISSQVKLGLSRGKLGPSRGKLGPSSRQKSSRTESLGGQKGGDCRDINFNAFIVLFAYKIITEYVHDIGSGDRGAAVKNSEIYDKVLRVFTEIANDFKNGPMGQAIVAANDEPSKTWLTELDNVISTINEDKYMSTIIRAIVTHCPDMVNEFYYKPMHLYICKYDQTKMTRSQYDTMYELFRDKIIELFPVAEWMMFVKKDDTKENIHLYIFKNPDPQAILSNRNLGMHTQDMGLEDIPLGIALKLHEFTDIHQSFFQSDADNNIDVFFQADGNINPVYSQRITAALEPLESGTINAGVITNDSIQLFTPLKGLDPFNSHKFRNGSIMDKPDKPEKLYVGYPPGVYQGFLAAVPLTQGTRDELTYLNQATYDGTIDTMNKLLSYWISNTNPAGAPLIVSGDGVPQIVDAYTFTVNATGNVYGVNFTGPFNFIFELHFEETTVLSVCTAMVNFYGGIIAGNNLIEQMEHIYNHPGFRFKQPPGSEEERNMKLAILASFKSDGDEGQRLVSKYLSILGNKFFFLTKDRVLLVETIKFNHPLLAITQSPDESFNPIDPNERDVSIRGISCTDSGILSNRRGEIDKIKNTFELLEEAIINYDTNIGKLQQKTNPPPPPQPQPPCYTNAQGLGVQLSARGITNPAEYDAAAQVYFEADQAFTNAKAAAEAAGSDAAGNDAKTLVINKALTDGVISSYNQTTNDVDNRVILNELVRYNGIIKQLLTSLQYIDQSINPDKINQLISTQIQKAVSIAISDKLMLKQILAISGRENLNLPFTTTTNLADVLKLLHNEIEFSSKVIESHGIACDEMIKNIEAFKEIIDNNTYTQADAVVNIQDKIKVDRKQEFFDKYTEIIKEIQKTKRDFLNEYKTDLVTEITKIQNARSGRDAVPADRKKLLDEITTLEGRITILRQQQQTQQEAIAKIDPVIKDLDDLKKTPLLEFKKIGFAMISSSVKSFFSKGKVAPTEKLTKAAVGVALLDSKAEKTRIQSFISDLLENTKTTFDSLLKKKGKFIATNHKKSEVTLSELRRQVSIQQKKGGKNKTTRQNKQNHHKKYTKRYNKKTYRKRSQKHLKNKKHKYTKRH